jgi:hypothetical protein
VVLIGLTPRSSLRTCPAAELRRRQAYIDRLTPSPIGHSLTLDLLAISMLLSLNMAFVLFAFETRKPGFTPEQFADYYDNVHVPLIKELVGDAFPVSHVRYYNKRISGAPDFTPLVFTGSPDNVNFDCISVMTFEDDAHATRFQTKYAEPEVFARLEEDAAKYIAEGGLTVFGMGAPHVTKP